VKEEIAARIRAITDEMQLSQSAMAARLGMPLGSYKKYASGISAPGAEAIGAFVALGINATWLLTGRGERWAPQGGDGRRLGAITIPAGFVLIPRFDPHGADGSPDSPQDASVGAGFWRDWLEREAGAPAEQLVVVYVDGDSMEPTLRHGDLVLVDRSAQELRQDGIYVLMLDGHMTIKRLQRVAGRRVRVTSSNPAYEPFEVDDAWDDADHWIVGRVVWAGRRL